jgi:SET domain-containing protein 6
MEAFHLQGSRILSRSFTIPRRRADPELWSQPKEAAENEDEDSDDEEEEEEGEAVMIPMADMLNAGCNMGNVHLFGDEDMESDEGVKDESLKEQGPGYTMCTTRAIQKGEQIVCFP